MFSVLLTSLNINFYLFFILNDIWNEEEGRVRRRWQELRVPGPRIFFPLLFLYFTNSRLSRTTAKTATIAPQRQKSQFCLVGVDVVSTVRPSIGWVFLLITNFSFYLLALINYYDNVNGDAVTTTAPLRLGYCNY
jgi:hypothetical protein